MEFTQATARALPMVGFAMLHRPYVALPIDDIDSLKLKYKQKEYKKRTIKWV